MKIIFFFIIFLLFIISSNSTCIQNQNNCEVCHPLNNICLKCISDNYFPDKNGGCEPKCILGKNFCNQCDEDFKKCIFCEEGYYPDEIGGCAYIPNCYSSYNGKCLQCEEDYILIGDKNSFKICKSKNTEDLKYCEIINTLNGLCEKCQEGFYLNSGDLKCSEIENCYQANYGVCLSCIEGYYLNKKANKCLKNNENFIYCKETIDGETCDTCISRFYLAENGQCTNTLMCNEAVKGKCINCIDKFYLTEDNSCTTEEKCEYGDGDTALCNYCYSGYYLDNKEKKCKIQNSEEYKHCEIYDNGCIECEINYYIGEDLKCSKTKNCKESENEICIECKDGYYLGYDNKCTTIEHCIYSDDLFECEECEEGYYFNLYNKACLKAEDNFNHCKIAIFEKDKCSLCKDDYFLNKTDYLCYDNTHKNSKYYNCEFTDYNGDKCDKCKKGYYLSSGEEKCITVSNCKYSKNENECKVCEDTYCLDVKKKKCMHNDFLENENQKIYIACNRTNDEGDKCELCLDGYEVDDNGICVNEERCVEKENGICLKCMDDESSILSGYYYCANEVYGCLKTIIVGCKQCNNFDNLFSCSECHDGYYLNDEKKCNRQ